MKRTMVSLARASLLAVSLVGAGRQVQASGSGAPQMVEIRAGWIRALPRGLPCSGYFTLENRSERARVLTGAASPRFGEVDIHQSYTGPDGGARMRAVSEIPIPARGRVVFAPGGYHLMMLEPREEVRPGEQVEVVLTFKDGGSVEAWLPARPAAHAP